MDQEASRCAPLGLSEEMKSGPGGSCACGAWVFNSGQLLRCWFCEEDLRGQSAEACRADWKGQVARLWWS